MLHKLIDPGQFCIRLDLEAANDVEDGQGGVLRRWQQVKTVWTCIEPLSTRAIIKASAEGMVISHRIWLGTRGDIKAGMRFRRGARVLNIKLVNDPDETGRFITCHCEEEDA